MLFYRDIDYLTVYSCMDTDNDANVTLYVFHDILLSLVHKMSDIMSKHVPCFVTSVFRVNCFTFQ